MQMLSASPEIELIDFIYLFFFWASSLCRSSRAVLCVKPELVSYFLSDRCWGFFSLITLLKLLFALQGKSSGRIAPNESLEHASVRAKRSSVTAGSSQGLHRQKWVSSEPVVWFTSVHMFSQQRASERIRWLELWFELWLVSCKNGIVCV